MNLLPKIVPRRVALLTHLRSSLRRDRLRPHTVQPDHHQRGLLRISPNILLMHERTLLSHVAQQGICGAVETSANRTRVNWMKLPTVTGDEDQR
jgi:hypothetical protein